MTERLLQYIWQYQHFSQSNLQTVKGELLQVLQPGTYNTNQGPDFINAKIRIGNTTWAGSIELHVRTSEWRQHGHSTDNNYNNVILHVVWIDDEDLHTSFPTLELQAIVSKLLLDRYDGLMQATQFIPCEKQVGKVDELTIVLWKQRLMVERLQQRTVHIGSLLQKNNMHWEEVFWWLLARNFGTKINSDAFEKMAQSIPLNTLAKHRHQLLQVEALLMGQAGLLEKKFNDEHPLMLQKEYRFLQKKYKLKKTYEPVYFLRMRPAAFPGIRLSQLAVLISVNPHLFSTIKEKVNFNDVEKILEVTAGSYWDDHYTFDELSAHKKKTLGRQMINNLLINTVIPVLYAYGYFNSNEQYQKKALHWMEVIPAESNSITKGFELVGLENKTALDSQSFIQLKSGYCDQRQCLQCAIGNRIIKAADHQL